MNIFNIFKRQPVKGQPTKHRQASLADCTPGEPTDAAGNRRIIQTARTVETINEAASNGFRPLVKPVRPCEEPTYQV